MLAKKFALAFGIAALLPFLVYYGVSTFSPAPRWDYETVHGFGVQSSMSNVEYNLKRKQFQHHLFYVAAPLGLISLIVGSFLSIPAVGTGLMFGGVFTFLEGVLFNWSEIQDTMKFVLLLITFVILIWIGYGKLSNQSTTANKI